MKFVFADSLDFVDPRFDFVADRSPPDRQPYWDDAYPHEILGFAPYDGVLVSRGIVGDHRVAGKYSASQARRFALVGARNFLRLEGPDFAGLDIFGDCGAFTYVQEDIPPYSPAEMAEFYDDCGFTHGCSVDHIIFDFNPTLKGSGGGSEEARRRQQITLENADAFRRETRTAGAAFTPMGVVQGWSPGSMADAARQLVAMGYDYLAIGGMVPLRAPEIKLCLSAIREAIPRETRIHILGFAKADDIEGFRNFGIDSFDTTSPLIRAFKDGSRNFYLPGSGRALRYYTAVRVPQAIENPRLQRLVKRGTFNAEDLVRLERAALDGLRSLDCGECEVEPALAAIIEYNAPLVEERPYEDCSASRKLALLAERYRRTLTDRPWTQCACAICRQASVDVIIFRGSNRNKRRGIHNLGVYRAHLKQLEIKHVG
jgi:hypothetical protein